MPPLPLTDQPTALHRHPDKNANNKEEATVKFQQVSAAYARLTGADESDDDLDDVSALTNASSNS